MWCCDSSAGQQTTETATVIPEPVKEEEPPPEEPKPKYTIMVVGARGFRNTDWQPGLGKPDCYVEVKLGDEKIFTSKTIDDSMMPRWFEEFQVWELEDGKTLEFKVWDKDVVGADFLGKVDLVPSDFAENPEGKKGCNKDFEMENSGTKGAYLGLKLKLQNQAEYPEGRPPQFEASIEKAPDAKEYGLEIDSQDNKHLQVFKVDEGAVKKYNETVDPDLQIMKSDFIEAVNGVTGSAAELMAQFTQPTVAVKILRATELQVVVENNDKKVKHGLTFPKQMKNDVLVVMDIDNDGYVKKYNDSCTQASQRIRQYDRIVSVKGQVGKAARLKSLLETTTGKFQLGIQRPVPSEATQASGGNWTFW
jgi:hypothetical protein